jgi:hypothetical protein
MADRTEQRRTARAILARWRWLAYLALLTFVLVLVESTRATRANGPQMPVQHAAVNPR